MCIFILSAVEIISAMVKILEEIVFEKDKHALWVWRRWIKKKGKTNYEDFPAKDDTWNGKENKNKKRTHKIYVKYCNAM